MSEKPPSEADSSYDESLRGTTYKVYRYLLRNRDPVGISKVQKALNLSSSSVSDYHLKKLLRLGLVREKEGGYVVDRVVIDNIIRIGRISLPVQTGYVFFFGATLVFLVLFLTPATISSLYFFSLVVNVSALVIASYEVLGSYRRLRK